VVPAGVVVASSLDEALEAARGPDIENVFVVGGAEIYSEALTHSALRFIYLTRVEGHFATDVRIPDLDGEFVHDVWDGEQTLEDSGVTYRIERLRRRG
jgi:dihydrofolate reductase